MYYEVAPTDWIIDLAANGWFFDLPLSDEINRLEITVEWLDNSSGKEPLLACSPAMAIYSARVGPTSMFEIELGQSIPTGIRIQVSDPPTLFVYRTVAKQDSARHHVVMLCQVLEKPQRALQRNVGVVGAIARIGDGDLDGGLAEFGFACLSGQADDARAIASAVLEFMEHYQLVRSSKLGEMVGALAGLVHSA